MPLENKYVNKMKLLIPAFILLMAICSCKNSESKTQKEIAKEKLADHIEKIVLLSEIKKIPYDTLKLILTDYYYITSEHINSPDSLKFFSEKAIDIISEKYHVSKPKVASLIFSFKYEMLSREEIMEAELERLEYEQQEPPEDPR